MEKIHVHKVCQLLNKSYDAVYKQYGKLIKNSFIDISCLGAKVNNY